MVFYSLTSGGIETISADDRFGKGTPSKKPKDRTDGAEGDRAMLFLEI